MDSCDTENLVQEMNEKLDMVNPSQVIANENFLLEEKKSKDESAKLRNENQKLRDEIAKLQNQYQKLGNQDEKLRDETEKLQEKIIDLITCQICFERFQSAGERTPCKLRCPHIMCKKCAEDWLKMETGQEVGRVECPTCRMLYTQNDISPINLNYDL